VSQPLFQAGQAYLGYRQAQLGREEAGALVLSSRQQLLFQVTQAYYGLHLARETLGVVKKALETARQHLKIAEDRYRSGAVIQSDVLSAQVHLAQITQEEITAASQVQVAQSALATVVGLPEIGSRPLAPPPREAATLPEENLTDLQSTAQEKRPDLKRLTLAARVAQQEYAKARLNYLPRVQLVAEYDVDQRRLFGASADSYTVMALMNFNLFNGLADLARVRESRAQEAQARDLKQELEDRIRHQVTEAILSLKTAQARLKVARTAVAQARESLRLVRLRYETGLTILVDLLSTEDALKNAELSQVLALFDTHLAQAGLELALGTISGPAEEAGAGR
jgi:outer membrane protein TolC